MHDPFEAGVPIHVGICAVIAIVCFCAFLIGLIVYFQVEWLFSLVPIAAGARAGYYMLKGK